jgi:hypothetical protein
MKFLFKYATRQRPDWFKKTLGLYYAKMSGEHPFQFVVTADSNDATMNNPEILAFLNSQPNLSYRFGEHAGKIEAINADMDLAPEDWQVLVVVSDDMTPWVANYDRIIAALMTEHFPGLDGALHFDDGCQGRDVTITLSIMGRKLYEHFGYIYHPDYKSVWCDQEFTDQVRMLGKVHFERQIIIQHEWDGEDELVRHNEGFFQQDKETYYRRRDAGFPKESIHEPSRN